MQSKILAKVKYFHLYRTSRSARCAIVRQEPVSVLPAGSRSELHSCLDQPRSNCRRAHAEGEAELGDALAVFVSSSEGRRIERRGLRAGSPLLVQADARVDQPTPRCLECDTKVSGDRRNAAKATIRRMQFRL
jgi:hypothetical protein